MSKRSSLPTLAAFAAALALAPAAAQAAEIETALISRASGLDGAPSDAYSADPSVSQDGRFVAFASEANGLSDLDDDDHRNVFVRDRATGITELISRGPGGPANGDSYEPEITPDGRYVVFTSKADNLAPSDANGHMDDVFVYDRATQTITHASRVDGPNGAGADASSFRPSISDDGTKVAFMSLATNLSDIDGDAWTDVFVRDLAAGTTELVSVDGGVAADNASSRPAISGDGTDVAFVSMASNLAGGGAPLANDVFVRNLVNGTTSLASRPTGFTPVVGNGESDEPTISRTGRYVAFATAASNLVDTDDDTAPWRVLRRDMLTGSTVLVSRGDGANGPATALPAQRPQISADGAKVAFATTAQFDPAAKPGVEAVYTRDLSAGTTTLVSRATGPNGEGVNVDAFDHDISADGATVAFATTATNVTPEDVDPISDVFVRGTPIAPLQDGGGGGGNGGGGGGGGGGGQKADPEAAQPQSGQPAGGQPQGGQPAAPAGTPTVAPTLRLRLVKVGRRAAKVRVTCRAAGTAPCVGTLRLKRPSGKGRALGRASFTVAPNGQRVVRVKLRRGAAKRLAAAKRPKVRAIATVTAGDAPARTISRKLRAARR